MTREGPETTAAGDVLRRQHAAYREALGALVGAVTDVAERYPSVGAALAAALDSATRTLQQHGGSSVKEPLPIGAYADGAPVLLSGAGPSDLRPTVPADAWPEPGDVVDGRIVRDADDDRPDGA